MLVAGILVQMHMQVMLNVCILVLVVALFYYSEFK